MKKIQKSLLLLLVMLMSFFSFSCFEDDEEDDFDEYDQLYYDYYGYDDDDYDYDDDEDYDYYYGDEEDDDYYDDEGEGWFSTLLDWFGLGDDYDDEYYDDYGDDEDYEYDDSTSSSQKEYEYYFNDTTSTKSGASSFYAVDDSNAVKENVVPDNAADWTVFIYLCGSDLETQHAEGVTDIKQMLKTKMGSNVNVLIATGGANKWHGMNISNKDTEYYIIKDNKLKKVESLPKASMGKASTLSNFISWGAKNYPAKKYELTFWDHGSGSVYGVCLDERYEGIDDYADTLLAHEIKQALLDGGVYFELFSFDCCLSATLEMADTLAPFGKYMVASEEFLRGGNFGYDEWFTSLSTNPEQTGADLGKKIAKFYSTGMKESGYGNECTISVIDLSKIERVKLAFQAMAANMTQKTQNVQTFKNLVRIGTKGVKFGSTSTKEGYTNLIDLGEFAKNAEAEVPEQSKAVIDAIKHAVLFEVHGQDEGNATGIAVYYPVKYNGDTKTYADNVDNRPYLQYLDAILDKWTAPEWVYQDKRVRAFTPVKSKNYDVTFKSYLKETRKESRYAVKIESGLDSVNYVTMNLYWYDEENKKYLYLGNDDDIIPDWKKGEFLDNFNAEWITIGGCYVNAELIEAQELYNYYSVPIKLNGKDTNLRLKYNLLRDKFKIQGVYDGMENGASSKGLRRLKDGDKLEFIMYEFDEDKNADNNESTEYLSGKVTYSEDIEIAYSQLSEGYYYYQFQIEDIFGNLQYSDYIEMEYRDGLIYLNYEDED